jgi:hypothetical protein
MKKNQLASLSMKLIVVSILTVLSSCGGDDNDPKKTNVDVDNPNEVAKSLKVENATLMTGNPPSPTGGSAPVIDEFIDGTPIFTIQGLKIIVSAPIESGDAAGFYVKIDGADGYFKVNSAKADIGSGRKASLKKRNFFKTGRKQEEDEASFSIEVPEGIEPGEFCITYCVFNSQGQVSNVIGRCVIVSELGGSNAEFLSKEWSWLNTKLYEDGNLIDEVTVGVADEDTYEAGISCDGEWNEIVVTDSDLNEYGYLKFSKNGAFQIDEKYSYTYYDWDSECTPEYITETEEETWTGAWSYDDDSHQLIILYNLYYDEDYPSTLLQTYDAEMQNGKLILTNDTVEELGYVAVITLEEK